MFLLLLDDFVQGMEDEEEEAEIKATYLYTLTGMIMPPYCHDVWVCISWNPIRRIHRRGSG